MAGDGSGHLVCCDHECSLLDPGCGGIRLQLDVPVRPLAAAELRAFGLVPVHCGACVRARRVRQWRRRGKIDGQRWWGVNYESYKSDITVAEICCGS